MTEAESRGVRVTVSGGPSEGRVAVGHRVTVGRGAKADIVLADPAVSEMHVEFRAHEDGIFVIDLDSAGGTRFQDARLGPATTAIPPDTS